MLTIDVGLPGGLGGIDQRPTLRILRSPMWRRCVYQYALEDTTQMLLRRINDCGDNGTRAER
jgi:hypothetical protein